MVFFMRHGETDYNRDKKWMGQTDISLNDIGREQVKITAQKLINQNINVIYTSPLLRAYESALIIANEINVKNIITIDELKERSFGELEGTLKTLTLRTADQPIQNIESNTSFTSRLKKALTQIDMNNSILIVSHSNVFKALVKELGFLSNKSEITNGEVLVLTLT